MRKELEYKQAEGYAKFDTIVYAIMCIATCGLVYLLRVLITYAVRVALIDLEYVKEYRKEHGTL